ncbi:MAG TPA: hypothetical protein ENJ35_07580 [Gammaproteobacteria bacterium]|nr:hypothetical protein [Gammaproteobacteria bacterium]
MLDIGGKLIDRFFPDPQKKAEAQIELARMAQAGDLKELEVSMSAIIAEAKSNDPWTSRARPSFLYVMYVMILSAVPMGVLHALKPEFAAAITVGMKAWLAAIPEEMWWLFGAGYLGYSTARSADKRGLLKGLKNKL